MWTAIDCAAANGHEKVLRVLIEAGAEVNPVETQQIEGEEVNATDTQQTTPLHLAVQEGHLGAVMLLLEHHADVGKCVKGLNALDVAIDNNYE